jgi:hypothetical protein
MVRVLLAAQLHRDAYAAGAPFKVLVDVACADDALGPRKSGGTVPYDTGKLELHRYAPTTDVMDDAAHRSDLSGSTGSTAGLTSRAHSSAGLSSYAVVLESLSVSFAGTLRMDTTRSIVPAGFAGKERAESVLGDEPVVLPQSTEVYDIFPPLTLELLRTLHTREKIISTKATLAGDMSESAALGDLSIADGNSNSIEYSPSRSVVSPARPSSAPSSPITKVVGITQGARRSFAVSGTIPTNCPPSLRSQGFRFDYRIVVHCTWRLGAEAGSAPLVSTQLMTTSLRMPVAVTSPSASLRLLRWPYWVDALHADAHCLRAIAVPPRPTPKTAPPLSDHLLTADADIEKTSVVSPLVALLKQVRQRVLPTELTLRHRGSNAVIAVVALTGNVVRAGESLTGAILPELAGGELTCVRVRVALECDELVPVSSLTPGTVIPDVTRRILPRVPDVGSSGFSDADTPAENLDDFVVMSRRTYDVADCETLWACQVPFELSTANTSDPTHACGHTIHMEMVRQVWLLRITMVVARTVDVTAHHGAIGKLTCAAPDEFELPITVYAAETNPRAAMGPTVWAF